LLREPLGRQARLLERVLPVAVELEDLGAMHQASACEGNDVGLLTAPAREGRSPLLRATDFEHPWQARITPQ
jgi:hypothetical protein